MWLQYVVKVGGKNKLSEITSWDFMFKFVHTNIRCGPLQACLQMWLPSDWANWGKETSKNSGLQGYSTEQTYVCTYTPMWIHTWKIPHAHMHGEHPLNQAEPTEWRTFLKSFIYLRDRLMKVFHLQNKKQTNGKLLLYVRLQAFANQFLYISSGFWLNIFYQLLDFFQYLSYHW